MAQDAGRGARTIRVQDSIEWAPGQRIVVTSTTQNPRQSEERVIEAIDGQSLRLNGPLRYRHGGNGPARAHVALLTRNVLITSKNPELRGHTLFLEGSDGSISYAEYRNLGARGQKGKYPIHFHQAGQTMPDSYVKGVSIWNSDNRFITVHSTQYVKLIENVGYNAIGHGFFLEEGDEVFVTLDRNLGITVNPGQILRTDMSPAVFWIQNPVNTITNNIAVGSLRGSGFEFAIIPGRHKIPALGGAVEPRKLPLLRFEGNETHSNGRFGVRAYRFNTPEDEISELRDVKVWRNRNAGLSLVGNRITVSDAFLFGNRMVNVTLMGNDNAVENSTILGELDSTAGQIRIYPPSSRGLVIGGKDTNVADRRFRGHVSWHGITGSDITLNQSHESPVTGLIVNSVMESERPIIFGYPINEASRLEVRAYK